MNLLTDKWMIIFTPIFQLLKELFDGKCDVHWEVCEKTLTQLVGLGIHSCSSRMRLRNSFLTAVNLQQNTSERTRFCHAPIGEYCQVVLYIKFLWQNTSFQFCLAETTHSLTVIQIHLLEKESHSIELENNYITGGKSFSFLVTELAKNTN